MLPNGLPPVGGGIFTFANGRTFTTDHRFWAQHVDYEDKVLSPFSPMRPDPADKTWRQQMLQESEALYNRCLDLDPNHIACHRALAVLLVDTNRPQNAFLLLERWSNRNPQLADAKIELARLSEEFGEKDRAKQYLTEAIDVNPNNARAWSALARLREQDGELAQALNNYQQAYFLNNYQPGVAQRIASVQQQIRTDSPTPPGGTRTVENPQGWTTR